MDYIKLFQKGNKFHTEPTDAISAPQIFLGETMPLPPELVEEPYQTEVAPSDATSVKTAKLPETKQLPKVAQHLRKLQQQYPELIEEQLQAKYDELSAQLATNAQLVQDRKKTPYEQQQSQIAQRQYEVQQQAGTDAQKKAEAMQAASAMLKFISPSTWVEVMGNVDMTGAQELLADVFLDPTTYLSAGTIPLLKVATKEGAEKVLREAAERGLREGFENARKASKYYVSTKDNYTHLPEWYHQSRIDNGGFEKIKGYEGADGQLLTPNSTINYTASSPDITEYNGISGEAVRRVRDELNKINHNMNFPTSDVLDLLTYQPALGISSSGVVYMHPGWHNLLKSTSKIDPNITDTDQLKYLHSLIKSHEIDHALHVPTELAEGFDLSKTGKYFSQQNNTELAARGTQLKDYFGFTHPDQKLTGDMLRYAKDHYVKDTGINNDMIEFFNSIIDFDKAAEWLNKHATAITVPTIVGGTAVVTSFQK